MTINSSKNLKKTENINAIVNVNTVRNSRTETENETYERSIKELHLKPIDPEIWDNANLD